MEDCNKTIGYRIAAVRGEVGESQADLAAALGVKREMVNYWENGVRPIKADMIVAIAKKYGVSADYLLGFTNPDVKTPAIETRAICDYTGLSEEAIRKLHTFTTESEEHVFNRDALNYILSNYNLIRILGDLAFSEQAAETWAASRRGVVVHVGKAFMRTDEKTGKVELPGDLASGFFLRQAEHDFSVLVQDFLDDRAKQRAKKAGD